MALLELRFVGSDTPELFESSCRLIPGTICSAVRGKTSGAYRGYGTFQWTSAVKAVCVALLRAKVCAATAESSAISGEKGSLGFTPAGGLIARRLFLVSNPNRKRPGPVVIVLNERVLATAEIKVSLDGKVLTSTEDLQRLLNTIGGATELVTGSTTKASSVLELPQVVNG